MNDQTFGGFIKRKREENGITLREFARMLDVSAPFLVDVEKGRRNPFDMEKLVLTTSLLKLSKEEKDYMMDLAGKMRETVAPDLPKYIMEHDYVSAALRTARDLGAGAEEWQQFIEELKRRKG